MAKESPTRQFKVKTNAGQYVVHLLAALLNGEPSPPLPHEITWEQVYETACMHSVESITFYAAVDFLREQASELCTLWEKRCQINLIQSMTQLSERDRIIKALTSAGIRVLPVKGCMMKEIYPQIDWRQMCDLDILIDEQNAVKARSIVEELGYQPAGGTKKDDSFFLPPFTHIELHHKLFESWFTRSAEYFTNTWVWSKAKPDAKHPGCFLLSPEDEYLYQMAHFNRHFTNGYGSGIRSILDLEVYRRYFAGQLDETYIQNELRKLDLIDVGSCAESLSMHWFGTSEQRAQPLEKRESEMAAVVLYSGTYGTTQSRAIHYSQEGNQKLLKKWIFLPVDLMKLTYPVLDKYPSLYPFCWLHRLFARRQNVGDAIKTIFWGK